MSLKKDSVFLFSNQICVVSCTFGIPRKCTIGPDKVQNITYFRKKKMFHTLPQFSGIVENSRTFHTECFDFTHSFGRAFFFVCHLYLPAFLSANLSVKLSTSVSISGLLSLYSYVFVSTILFASSCVFCLPVYVTVSFTSTSLIFSSSKHLTIDFPRQKWLSLTSCLHPPHSSSSTTFSSANTHH